MPKMQSMEQVCLKCKVRKRCAFAQFATILQNAIDGRPAAGNSLHDIYAATICKASKNLRSSKLTTCRATSTLNLNQDICAQLVATSTVISAAMIYMRATICKRARTECGQQGQHQQEGN